MSDVVLGIGASHSTLMNTDADRVRDRERVDGFAAALDSAREVLERSEPDALVCIGSNHFRGFYLDLLPTFTIGVGECIGSGEAGTPRGSLPVDTDLARHLLRSVVAADFDMAFSLRLQVDHGITHAIQYLTPDIDVPIVPIIVNVFASPFPSLARCDHLGRELARAIATDGDEKRVAVVGSGGLSHALPFPKWEDPETESDHFYVEAWLEGRENWQQYDAKRREYARGTSPRINEDFDREFLGLLERGELSQATTYSDAELEALAGNGGHEIRTWLTMAAAAGHRSGRTLGYFPIEEWLTGMAVAVVGSAAV